MAQDGHAPFTVAFLLVPGFALMSYAAAVEPLRAANALSGRTLYRWSHVAPRGGAVESSGGLSVPCAQDAGSEPPAADLILVCAGGDPIAFDDARAFGWLRLAARRGLALGGVSGGPAILARAGVMAGRRMTVHWEHADALAAHDPSLLLARQAFVRDRDRLTCAGGAAALDMMLSLIAERQGAGFARRVGDWFVHLSIRPAEGAQTPGAAARLGLKDGALAETVRLMESHLADPLPPETLARLAGLSRRQLDRHCVAATGRTVAALYRDLRLDAARDMARSVELSAAALAEATGFAGAGHFAAAYRRRFGVRPGRPSA
ncbi:GlxA family transcriptional regulator [Rubrimonas cliftonensis]|uniref:Transcriptional regulator, AraC family with amidase-like domain n=1 Tax=Rubrimonas cliftonensis TaxID=89524 RepID=A0A1H4CFJ1_9RHOB|nr:helix-turn-helix domain-containing protein [Rubrimonas cliftonensis]SEA59100.1 transcriptional regulator, AraC family with amidase-like domain [Rubrimonas cliftonensis]